LKTRFIPRVLMLLSLLVALSGCGLHLTRPDDGAEADPTGLRDAPLALAVYKERREMVLMRHGVPAESFPVRLGRNPFGHKVAQGDKRTPEGVYRVCTVKPSQYRSFLWLSYPNQEDAAHALAENRLSRGDYGRIVNALETGRCPPADTPLGGLVGIHGDREEPARWYDWTDGCVALTRNDDVLRLSAIVPTGTPVVIYP
jgi:murein L,D-transpeptidase YafK